MSAPGTVRRNVERLAVWLVAAGIVVFVAVLVGLVPAPELASGLPV